MTDRPLVSIVTPTWQRPELLADTIEHVRQQTYRPLEHVVVSDGPDDRAEAAVAAAWGDAAAVPLRFVGLGRNWSTFLPRSFGVAPILVGSLVARGAYQTWLCDDERMAPHHVWALVDLIERTGADFVYPKVLLWRPGQDGLPGMAWEIGRDPPQHGQITSVLYRANTLARGVMRFNTALESDWSLVQQWMDHGATWAHLPEVTLRHRVDHPEGIR